MRTTTQAHFDNIQSQILKELREARHGIKIAMAWFTDQDLLQVLTSKAGEGVSVELILGKVSLNGFDKSEAFSSALQKSGGEVFRTGAASFEEGGIMHNKFAIIDFHTVVTGSYNWTNQAQRNHENIVIIKDPLQAEVFVEKFEALKAGGEISYPSFQEENLQVSFTCTKNRVDPGQPFELHWETRNADHVHVDGEYVGASGQREVRIYRDTYFTIKVQRADEIRQKSLWVRIIQEPEIKYELTVLDPDSGSPRLLKPSSPLRDTFTVVEGMTVTLQWEVLHTELLRINGADQKEQGTLSFSVTAQRTFTLEAFGIKHRTAKSFTINALPIPKLDRLISPLPGDIKINAEFDFWKVDIPASFTLSGNPMAVRIPRIQQLKSTLVNQSFAPSVEKPKKKETNFNRARVARRNKKRLQRHLQNAFRSENYVSPLLEKILKRYE
jgi:hypothetical protein